MLRARLRISMVVPLANRCRAASFANDVGDVDVCCCW